MPPPTPLLVQAVQVPSVALTPVSDRDEGAVT
jgi:hypothetical protein